jgi:hypothetical protein
LQQDRKTTKEQVKDDLTIYVFQLHDIIVGYLNVFHFIPCCFENMLRIIQKARSRKGINVGGRPKFEE